MTYKAATAPAVYLGIDPATLCGWGVVDATGRRVASGSWSFASRGDQGAGMRYLVAGRHFRRVILEHRPIAVSYEMVRDHRAPRKPGDVGPPTYNTLAAHVYGGLVAVLTATCEDIGVPYRSFEVSEIKKHATSVGNANKAMMVAAFHARWSRWPEDDNEADAMWIADLLRFSMEVPF